MSTGALRPPIGISATSTQPIGLQLPLVVERVGERSKKRKSQKWGNDLLILRCRRKWMRRIQCLKLLRCERQ